MRPSWRRLSGLFALVVLTAAACSPQETVRISASPTASPARTTAPAATTAGPSATPIPSPTASPSPARTASPGGTPATACAAQSGGSPLVASLLADVRAAHQAGADRLVFEWSGPAVPQYEVKVASSFQGPSGLAVPVDGNAYVSVRMGGQAHTNTTPAQRSYPEADPFRPGLPLIREVKVVEDFEGVVIFGVGLERLACPTVLTLLSPTRIVLDFPTPP